ncbi:divalent-cation tolerance protein CutA [Polynucleobacter sp. MWH-P3-07-1]|uniref:divalent-cation tolerance protein CutA n=1 Tax=Polynucleobacter sp. MWH-P3-07-1 TaxID=1743173 RepID=UPI001BFDCE8F|nr:divalent-cation tolerance protein CutA [Polynucleobacter sp. MWH-P3-07-1]QWD83586.1 divalent-cation tolerance protein CutA [Polynucleobacter sp. MWH-P3-07-1]
MTPNISLLVVTTSFQTLEQAQTIARQLVENRLAACVQIQQGLYSIYRWDGKICEENEVLLSAKTTAANWEEIRTFIHNNHPYDLPEIMAFTPIDYEQQYGKWIEAELESK